jgi:hypothetical protein
MKTPDTSTLVLLLFVLCLMFYSQFKRGGFSKMNYYLKYRSIIGYLVIPIVIMFLLIAIINN